jgi:hypothetical protein
MVYIFTMPFENMSKVTWVYTRAIMPHRCTITNNLLWGGKHYKVHLTYDSASLGDHVIFEIWVNSSDGTTLILSGELEEAILDAASYH